ncbi:MAG: hypothetical protein VW516_05710 [Rhodospirillaceae bacterium]|jgi:hypothetical protein
MADPKTTTPTSTTARGCFLLLAALCAKLQPPARGEAMARTCAELADLAADMPLTPVELADAYAALGSGAGLEAKDVSARRLTCAQLAELLAVSIGKVAGARPPTGAAMKVWAWISEAFVAQLPSGSTLAASDMANARASSIRSTAARELVELVGRAVVAVVGGAALVEAGARARCVQAAATRRLDPRAGGGRRPVPAPRLGGENAGRRAVAGVLP